MLSKEELKQKQIEMDEKAKKNAKGFFKDFKKFITRGNVVDMSIGVVIGGAFGAIVTALTNIFLSICTWAVPGGLKGLITVLPAAGEAQAGIANIGQTFSSSQVEEMARILKETAGYETLDSARTALLSKYTLHGSTYVFNGASIIDWGTFINAIISFLIIAMVLFIIIRVFASLQKQREEAHKRALEEYYKKHPEARPAPVAPGAPEPTDHQLLKEILAELRVSNNTKAKKKK